MTVSCLDRTVTKVISMLFRLSTSHKSVWRRKLQIVRPPVDPPLSLLFRVSGYSKCLEVREREGRREGRRDGLRGGGEKLSLSEEIPLEAFQSFFALSLSNTHRLYHIAHPRTQYATNGCTKACRSAQRHSQIVCVTVCNVRIDTFPHPTLSCM